MDSKYAAKALSTLLLIVFLTASSALAQAAQTADGSTDPYTVRLPLIVQTSYYPLTLVPTGAVWEYLDDGSDQGTAWRALNFDDSQWQSGPAPLGYGGDGEVTLIHYGPDPNNKYITYYFRHTFTIGSPAGYRALDLEMHCDDGAVVYLNGVEIYRFNMPEGEITSSTLAVDSIYQAIEQNNYHLTFDPQLLTAGANTLAVEIHQAEAASSDLGFGLKLMGTSAGNGVQFAAIGDYGSTEGHIDDTTRVADMIKSWRSDFILTLGDNNYPRGAADTIDANIGQFFHEYISPYKGTYGPGSDTNRFFPSLGNHDWIDRSGEPPLPTAYLDYFTLPGNERYYDFQRGPVQFFVLDSSEWEPDGFTSTSAQAEWLHSKMLASQAEWKIVYFHTPPFSGGPVRSSTPEMDWPFADWGADLVLSGHTHNYQRIQRYGINYIVNGAGGFGLYGEPDPIDGTVAYASEYGAVLVTANPCEMVARFIASGEEWVIDEFRLISDSPACDSVR